ncbi:MAG: aminodeoxychorismate synthase component I [Pyrinomonadaceae bacterium]
MGTARATQADKTTKPFLAREVNFTVEELLRALLALPHARRLSLLDSGATREGWTGGRLLIAGFDPFEIVEARGALMHITQRGSSSIVHAETEAVLDLLDARLREYRSSFRREQPHDALFSPLAGACIATFAYDYAQRIASLRAATSTAATPAINSRASLLAADEPDAVLAFYDTLIVHDYARDSTRIITRGGQRALEETHETICDAAKRLKFSGREESAVEKISHRAVSNFARGEYVQAVERVKEHIAAGDIYQANLTQQLTVALDGDNERFTPERIFLRLRRDHPAAFSAFIRRGEDVCVSFSPERFLRVEVGAENRRIEAWPIKGTRPRGATTKEDTRLRRELLASAKDRAENVMIVDLLRNDLGRVCEYGSIEVTKLGALEEHPTLFHLVSKVRGTLRKEATAGDFWRAAFPCGSITGAPKIRAMQIIDEIETRRRGLSMGATALFSFDGAMDSSVAIRTMTVRDKTARFNVGGGIVADSRADAEYEESLVKARALLTALNAELSV